MAAPRRLSILDVARVAWQAGFRGEQLVIAVAIAMRESGGNVGARCVYCIPRPPEKGGGYYPDHSHGLWQINILAHKQYDETLLETDPLYNAKAAFAVSGGGTNFRPWNTPANNFLAATNVPAVRAVLGQVFGRSDAEQILSTPVAGTMPNGSTPPSTGSATGGGFPVVPAGVGDLLGPIGSLAEGIFGRVFGGALDGPRKALLGGVANLAITGIVVAGGVGLAVAGLYRAAVGTRTYQRAEKATQTTVGAVVGGPAGAAAGAAQ